MIRSAPSISTTGPGRALEAPEVRQEVRLAGGAQLLRALVPAHLGEDVDGSRHVGSVSVSVVVRPVSSRRDRREFVELPFRLAL